MDLYPREGKFTHFAMWDLTGGYQNSNGQQVLPVTCLVGNFPKPTETTPSLLSMDEVSTLFHEFGHVLHGICGGARSKYHQLSGTKTETDFVEAPSQMKEQWVMEPEVLKKISRHYQTGECLTDETINKLSNSKFVGMAREWTRIASYALLDQVIHIKTHMTGKQMAMAMEEILSDYLHHPMGSGNKIATFGHIGSYSYNAKYYSYVWTMVLASDMYSRFETDPFDTTVGLEYRRKILEPGGTKKGKDMVEDFLGRGASMRSFMLNFIGLKKRDIKDKYLQMICEFGNPDEDDDEEGTNEEMDTS